MAFKHSREEVREAKRAALDHLRNEAGVTSIGIGLTEDEQDYAVTITVDDSKTLDRIPERFGTVRVRTLVTGKFSGLG